MSLITVKTIMFIVIKEITMLMMVVVKVVIRKEVIMVEIIEGVIIN